MQLGTPFNATTSRIRMRSHARAPVPQLCALSFVLSLFCVRLTNSCSQNIEDPLPGMLAGESVPAAAGGSRPVKRIDNSMRGEVT